MLIKNAKLILKDEIVQTNLLVKNGRIAAIGDDLNDEEILNLDGKYLAPGFVDIHNHGGYGYDYMDNNPEVESVALMSGAYDLSVIVKGKTFQEIAMFVAKELAVIDSVTSTATQFIMKQYKEFSVDLCSDEEDGRDVISL